jgi:hypothetical protein
LADTENAPENPDEDKAILAEAKERHKLCTDWWMDNRKAWLEDAKFRRGDQWPEKIKKLREDDNRPVVVVDKLEQYVRQVVNDGRQNRPGVKVRPEGNGAHADVAEVYEDLIRGICTRSNADEAFDTALDHAAGNGYGFFRVIADYLHPGGFTQELKVLRVRNPRSVMIDPFFQAADGSDARFGFVEEDVPKDDFKRLYPDAKFTDWVTDNERFGEGWLTDKSVRVCEYWYRVEKEELVHLLEDSNEMTDDEYQLAIKNGVKDMPAIEDSRKLTTYSVKFCRLTGAEILEQKDGFSQFIPLMLVMGNESDIDGKVTFSGLIRPAKDAQRLYNYSRAAYAERVSLTPKSPFVATIEQIEGHEEIWEGANTQNRAVLPYNHVDGVAPPQRQPASDIPEGFARDMQLSEHDIQGSMGMYNSSLGEKSNEKSGKAIMARQREGDTGTFHYPDNLNRAIRYMGRVLVDAAPNVYDGTRILYLVGEDGTHKTAQADPKIEGPVQQDLAGEKIYNISIGRYGVDVASGPSYTTKRQEALEAGMQLAQANPQMWGLIGDIIVRNADWPGADEISKRLKAMLPPQIQQMEQSNAQLPPEVMQAMQQVQQGQQQLSQAHDQLMQIQQQLQQEKGETEAEKAKLDAARQELQSQQKLLQSKYEELSAKLELSAMKLGLVVPPQMPPGKEEPAIDPQNQQPQPPPGGFFTP